MQARVDRRHHRDVDIAPAGRVDLYRRSRLGLRRAGVAVEEQRALRQARQRRQRGLVRLIGGDDGKDGLGARDRLRRARSPNHMGRDVIGAFGRSHLKVGELVLMS